MKNLLQKIQQNVDNYEDDRRGIVLINKDNYKNDINIFIVSDRVMLMFIVCSKQGTIKYHI